MVHILSQDSGYVFTRSTNKNLLNAAGGSVFNEAGLWLMTCRFSVDDERQRHNADVWGQKRITSVSFAVMDSASSWWDTPARTALLHRQERLIRIFRYPCVWSLIGMSLRKFMS
uniref:Uncharacterized protein n=1 Tax=Nothobranchius pienaari TaxID=704102 RepID=A0A1A8NVZ3_9TELE